MTKVLNFGSLNIDYVYNVEHFVCPGETICALNRSTYAGGKGLNQSTALAKAGAAVYHAGSVGFDSDILLNALKSAGVHLDDIDYQDAPSGHTIIQVDRFGQNCIIVFGGTNHMISKKHIDQTLAHFDKGDILLLQNEINNLSYLINKAYEKGLHIALNPSPIDATIATLPLEKIKYFIVNEIEGAQICGAKTNETIIPLMTKKYPHASILLTLGADGAMYFDGQKTYSQPIFKVKAVDTTAAGDTFLGYFINGLLNKLPIPKILEIAAKAASITVSHKGAAQSIPTIDTVLSALNQ